jgi:hypothetical protein
MVDKPKQQSKSGGIKNNFLLVSNLFRVWKRGPCSKGELISLFFVRFKVVKNYPSRQLRHSQPHAVWDA